MNARLLRPVAVVTAAFVAGALLNPFGSDAAARERPAPEMPLEAFDEVAPVEEGGEASPTESDRTEQGAVEAAAAFICNGQALVDMSADEVDTYLRERVTRASADRLVEEHLHDIDALREALATGVGPTTYRQGVLAWRVDAFDGDEARVVIWHVGVLSREGIAPPQAGWMTSTVDLRWERGSWKVAGEIAVPGPAPILNDSVPPATAADLLDQLDGFKDFGGAW